MYPCSALTHVADHVQLLQAAGREADPAAGEEPPRHHYSGGGLHRWIRLTWSAYAHMPKTHVYISRPGLHTLMGHPFLLLVSVVPKHHLEVFAARHCSMTNDVMPLAPITS